MRVERMTVVALAAVGVMFMAAGKRTQSQQAPPSQPPPQAPFQQPSQSPFQQPPQAPPFQQPSQEQTDERIDARQEAPPDAPLARLVREATSALQDPQAAEAAGYALASGCVSGPEEGAMGVHYGNSALLSDGVVDVTQPEVLVFEPRNNGQLQLVAAEYVVIAEQWHETNDHPPLLNGQHFHFVPEPNRTGLPAHYELHVWAWKRNPNGTFADFNPTVSCDSYNPQ